MLTDLRLALRLLRRAPGFAIAAIVCLTVGLGASTVAFSVLDAVALRPIPFPDAERLVEVHETSATQLCAGCGVGTSYDGFMDWRRDARAFDAMGAYVERPMVLGADATRTRDRASRLATRVQGAAATPSALGLVGARAVLGRSLVEADEAASAVRVVVIGSALWQRRFGADSSIVGRTIMVNGQPRVVVGVLAPRFRFPEFAELWVPLASAPPDGGRDERELGVIARLRRGVSASSASAEMATLAAGIARAHPDTQREWTAAVTPLRDDMAGDEAIFGWLLIGAVLLVQLVVCANLGGLLLVRAQGRWRELAVRAALGASRSALARHVTSEVALLAGAGAAIGFFAARVALGMLAARVDGEIPYWIELRADWRVAAFCALLTAVTVLVVGGGVARRASRPDVQTALKDAGPNASASRRTGRVRRALVAGELAATLVLLAAAGLFAKTSVRMLHPSDGADAARLVSADLALPDEAWNDPARITEAVDRLTARLAQLPRVEAAGATRFEFLAGFGRADEPITIEGRPTPVGASPRFAFAVTPGWWHVRHLRIAQGRALAATDGVASEPVAVVNTTMAERLWPRSSPLGRRVKLGPAASTQPWRTVVGVVADPPGATTDRPRSLVYVPFAQWPGRDVSLVIRARSAADAPSVIAEMPVAAASVLPNEPLDAARTLAEGARLNARPQWLIAWTLGALAGFAVLVAAIGVYGVVAYGVARRTREIGIRMALGASRQQVLALVGVQGARIAIAGALLGLAGAAAATRTIRGLLAGTDPLDLWVLGSVTAILVLIAIMAGYLPARRAARLDPTLALHME